MLRVSVWIVCCMVGVWPLFLQAAEGVQHLDQKMQTLEVQVDGLVGTLKQLERKAHLETQQLRRIQKEKAQYAQQLSAQQNKLNQQLRAAYLLGRSPRLKFLFSQEDPQLSARMTQYYRYFSAATVQQLTAYQKAYDHMVSMEQAIEKKKGKILSLQKEHRQRLSALLDKQGQYQVVESKLQQQLEKKSAQGKHAWENGQALGQVVSALQKKTEKEKQVAAAGELGEVICPTGRLLAQYGQPRKGIGRWRGQLFSRKQPSDVFALQAGKVVFSGKMKGYGQLMIIDHGHGYMSLYAHNSALFAQKGQRVSAQQIVAQSGARQLYFEVRYMGMPTNPNLLCTA